MITDREADALRMQIRALKERSEKLEKINKALDQLCRATHSEKFIEDMTERALHD